MNKLPRLSLVFLVLTILPCGFGLRTLFSAERLAASAVNSIVEDDFRKHITYLSSDVLEGREAGSAGSKAAAAYLAEKFNEYQLEPAGEKHRYEQHFGQDYRNLLGFLPGTDENLKQEVIVIGAHYDHVGYGYSGNGLGPVGQIHNGADDNASGVSAMLEIAQALHDSKLPLRRSVLFACWDGEEIGLLGSRHWTANPTLEFSRVKFYINLDMVGRLRNNRLEVYGSRTGTGLRRLFANLNQEGLEADFNWDIIPDSDHYSFVQREVPFLMPFTGKHPDYHRPSDDANTLNYTGVEKVTRHWLRILVELANRDTLPKYRPQGRRENERLRARTEAEQTPSRSRLGISWRSEESDPQKVLTIRNIAYPSPAWTAGLRTGDQILKLNGKPFEDTSGFVADIRVAARKSVFTVRKLSQDREEADASQEIEVILSGDPDLVGIAWKTDRADEQSLVISEVTAGAPAAEAGLRANDRLLAIEGVQIESAKAGKEVLSQDKAKFSIRFERDGRPHETTLSPLKLLSPPEKSDISTSDSTS
ncbi:MAG TPA: M20/M25/M40 family metallo-hydrolase [Planctomycetaceae bacterium]|nr:M20/M25/M40 family metallo-hydrolase [Planctomycetaceae bacterium]